MGSERKLKMFKTLCDMGFKEIEVGFPAASETDFNFCRQIIEEDLIPNDVVIQVLTQSRDELIRRTFEAIDGAHTAIIHLYNSTSTTQRRVVFNLDMDGVKKIATDGAELIKELVPTVPNTKIIHQYSPESYTQTELPYAMEVCEAVMDIWQPTEQDHHQPAGDGGSCDAERLRRWYRVDAPQPRSVSVILSLRTDRGTGVAATELGILAGAERLKALFGNGERTGNVDVIALAMNIVGGLTHIGYAQHARAADDGRVQPVAGSYRHPYAGDLVSGLIRQPSGRHQRGLKAMETQNSEEWDVPYLPIDPADVGASYEAVIRINSQSGKGGISYIMETEFGVQMPRALQVEFSGAVQKISDSSGEEQTPEDIWKAFDQEYLSAKTPYEFVEHQTRADTHASEKRLITAKVKKDGAEVMIEGSGNGPIDAYVDALKQDGKDIKVFSYSEHSVGGSSDATAIAFVETEVDGKHLWHWQRSQHRLGVADRCHCAVNRAIRNSSGMTPLESLSRQRRGRTRDAGG